MHTCCSAGRLVAAVLVLILSVPGARAAEVWRLAGSFNGWNAGDDAWAMTPRGSTFFIERTIAPGAYTFKFVKDGDWSRGHLGMGPDGNLVQPGEDLTLRVRHQAVYRVTLTPSLSKWSLSVMSAPEPVLDIRLLGSAVAQRPFVLDLSGSVGTGRPLDTGSFAIALSDLGDRAVADPALPMRWTVTPAVAGPMTITVRLNDMGRTVEDAVQINVAPNASLRYSLAASPDKVQNLPLEVQGDGSLIALLAVDAPMEFSAIDVIGLPERLGLEGTKLAAGTYAVIARDGAVITHDRQDVPSFLHRGEWRTATFPASFAFDTVHLAGDFNGWAKPGDPGAVRLVGRMDGSFRGIVRLTDGPQRYGFIVDGDRQVADPAQGPARVPGVGGPASRVIVGPSAAEFPAPQPNKIEEAALRHDPTSWRDFMPISSGLGLADVALSALPQDAQRVDLHVQHAREPGATQTIPMRRDADAAGFDRWTARVMIGGPSFEYWFVLSDGSAQHTTPRFKKTITPRFETPDWAKGAVWYQIFPERFRNGNPLNDPHGPGVYNKPWNDEWYGITPAEEAAWRSRYNIAPNEPWPPRKGGNLFNVVWDRRYGGDLQGIQEKLGYLKDLGVTALYMNPIFEAESMHKYDATDYRHIDDNLGTPKSAGKVPEQWTFQGEPADSGTWTWTHADRYFIDEFLPAARKQGIRVVLDGVFNHTGKPFFAFKDIMERGDKSPYKDWFYVTFDEQGALKSWVSWFNTGALPKFKQTADGDLVPPVKKHIFDVTRRWMDPNGDGDPSDGIDGWRLDVALDIGLPFWRDWRALVKSINPQAIIIAEIWDDASPNVRGDTFDTQMHYPFAKPVLDWLGVRPGTSASATAVRLDTAFDDAPQTNLIHQTLFASHDTDRYVSMLLNPGREYDQGNRPQDHDFPYVDKKPSEEIYRLSLLGVAMQALYSGAPMVYYGDEVGMWGADDPSDRKPFPWPDAGARADPAENPDWNLHRQYTQWLTLRSDPVLGPVLRFGATTHLDTKNDAVFAFERSLNGRRVVAVLNRSAAPFDAGLLLPAGTADARVGPVSAKYWLLPVR